MPHWENPGSFYFITFRTANSFILPEQTRQIVLESCKFHKDKKYDLYACVVMPDHAHLILQPLEKMAEQYYSLSEIMHSIKSYSANQINKLLNRTGTVWQDESFDRIVRDKHELMEKMNYIVNNPAKRGLVENREDYKWVYVEGWLGDDLSMVGQASSLSNKEYAKAAVSYLALIISRVSDFYTNLCRWHPQWEFIPNTFARQALSMAWDYAELDIFADVLTGTWESMTRQIVRPLEHLSGGTGILPAQDSQDGCPTSHVAVTQASATALPYEDNFFDAVFTDPPYYDNVPYSYLSDFFYVWLKRTLGDFYPELFSTPLTPKKNEIVAYSNGTGGFDEGKKYFEDMLRKSFQEIYRVLKPDGIAVIVYAHKSTEGWETLINSLLDSGLIMTGAWPLSTEMASRLRASESAALASSIYIVARKMKRQPTGFYNKVKEELKQHLNKKLERLWSEGIGGADFFIAAIGSAIEVFGKYEKVMDFEGNTVRADKMLEDVRGIATDYAVRKILHNGFAGEISDLTRFYVLFRWNYGEAKVQFDEARKLAQSCGIDLVHEWNKPGFIRKEKEFIKLLGPQERIGSTGISAC